MLLSPLNWLIHLSSSLEWGVALIMLYRYGQFIGRKDVRRFALFMLPHWIGSWFVLLYHISGDTIMRFLEMSEVINLVGSIALLYATLKILKGDEKREAKPAKAWMGSLFGGVMLVAGGSTPYSFMMGSSWFDAVLQVSSIVYLTFLVLLLKVRKKDTEVFSGLTVAGFWFVLVFISVTVVCMYIAIHVLGYQSLSHDDLLHGFAESLLSVSNLMIVIGIHKQRKLAEQRLRG
jgi:hypothetical protein